MSGETRDPTGMSVLLPADLWQGKILQNHPELAPFLHEILRAVKMPDLVLRDSVYESRRRYYLRDAGPSRWLLVVVSYEQTPARIVTAFGTRKDPPRWSK